MLIFDEMITGFRSPCRRAGPLRRRPRPVDLRQGAGQWLLRCRPCAASASHALGSRERDEDDVFLLSTTHGAETHALAAAIATMDVYEQEPVIEHMYRQGDQLIAGIREIASNQGVANHVLPVGYPSNLLFSTLDPDGRPSQAYRTLFLQEIYRAGRVDAFTGRQLQSHGRRHRPHARCHRRSTAGVRQGAGRRHGWLPRRAAIPPGVQPSLEIAATRRVTRRCCGSRRVSATSRHWEGARGRSPDTRRPTPQPPLRRSARDCRQRRLHRARGQCRCRR